VPNVPDHGFAGGNEDGIETNMAAEDAEFLEAMLRHHAEDPSVFFMKGGGPNEGSRRAFV